MDADTRTAIKRLVKLVAAIAHVDKQEVLDYMLDGVISDDLSKFIN